jgi:uncharacterized membrane protein YgcG
VATGNPFSAAERVSLEDTIRRAEVLSRAEFSVFVGASDGDPHAFATQLHNSLVAPQRSILIMVDPTKRVIEVVTGGWVRRTLTDRQADLAVVAMQTAFAEGSIADGLRRGITMLAEAARAPESLHNT